MSIGGRRMNKSPSGVALTFLGSKMTYATSESTGRDCPKVGRIGAGSSVPVVADHWRRTFAAVIAMVALAGRIIQTFLRVPKSPLSKATRRKHL